MFAVKRNGNFTSERKKVFLLHFLSRFPAADELGKPSRADEFAVGRQRLNSKENGYALV